MAKAHVILKEIFAILTERIQDSLLVSNPQQTENPLVSIFSINSRENFRANKIYKIGSTVNDALKQLTAQNTNEIGKYFYQASAHIFHQMKKQFRAEKVFRYDFGSSVSLYKSYFLQLHDLRMVSKLNELLKSKSLRKPVIILALLKIMIQTSRQFLFEKVKKANQIVTQHQVAEFNGKKDLRKTDSGETIKRIRLFSRSSKVIYPLSALNQRTRYCTEQQQFENQTISLKISKPAFRRSIFVGENRQKQKCESDADLHCKQLIQRDVIRRGVIKKPLQRISSGNALNELSQNQNAFDKASTKYSNFVETFKLSSKIFSKALTIATEPNSHNNSCPLKIRRRQTEGNIRVSRRLGIFQFLNIYKIIDIEEKGVSKLFFKKSRKYFSDILFRDSIARNKEIQKQISLFLCSK